MSIIRSDLFGMNTGSNMADPLSFLTSGFIFISVQKSFYIDFYCLWPTRRLRLSILFRGSRYWPERS
jgi:hypothetical protein